MTRRTLGLLLLLGAVAAYAGVVLPMRRATAAAGDAYARERERRRVATARFHVSESRRLSRERASLLLAGAKATPERPSLMDLRRSVLASLEGRKTADLKLVVTEGRSPVAARVHLSAQGSFGEIMGVTERLVRPGSGLVLDHVRVDPRGGGTALDLDGLFLERRP